jgi:hypothetical protein
MNENEKIHAIKKDIEKVISDLKEINQDYFETIDHN